MPASSTPAGARRIRGRASARRVVASARGDVARLARSSVQSTHAFPPSPHAFHEEAGVARSVGRAATVARRARRRARDRARTRGFGKLSPSPVQSSHCSPARAARRVVVRHWGRTCPGPSQQPFMHDVAVHVSGVGSHSPPTAGISGQRMIRQLPCNLCRVHRNCRRRSDLFRCGIRRSPCSNRSTSRRIACRGHALLRVRITGAAGSALRAVGARRCAGSARGGRGAVCAEKSVGRREAAAVRTRALIARRDRALARVRVRIAGVESLSDAIDACSAVRSARIQAVSAALAFVVVVAASVRTRCRIARMARNRPAQCPSDCESLPPESDPDVRS